MTNQPEPFGEHLMTIEIDIDGKTRNEAIAEGIRSILYLMHNDILAVKIDGEELGITKTHRLDSWQVVDE